MFRAVSLTREEMEAISIETVAASYLSIDLDLIVMIVGVPPLALIDTTGVELHRPRPWCA